MDILPGFVAGLHHTVRHCVSVLHKHELAGAQMSLYTTHSLTEKELRKLDRA